METFYRHLKRQSSVQLSFGLELFSWRGTIFETEQLTELNVEPLQILRIKKGAKGKLLQEGGNWLRTDRKRFKEVI